MVTVGYNPSTGNALMGTGGALCIGCCVEYIVANCCNDDPALVPLYMTLIISDCATYYTPGGQTVPGENLNGTHLLKFSSQFLSDYGSCGWFTNEGEDYPSPTPAEGEIFIRFLANSTGGSFIQAYVAYEIAGNFYWGGGFTPAAISGCSFCETDVANNTSGYRSCCPVGDLGTLPGFVDWCPGESIICECE